MAEDVTACSMLPLPDFVAACPATKALIYRASGGEFGGLIYDCIWDGLPKGSYDPEETVHNWVRENWDALMAGTAGETPARGFATGSRASRAAAT